jgi:hypothetical protein
MQIDSIAANADRIRKVFRAISTLTGLHPDMALQNRELSRDSTAFTDICGGRQTVVSTHDFWTEPKARITGGAIRARCVGLQPVHETQRQLAGRLQGCGPLRFSDSDERRKPVIHLRPVHEGDV